MTGTRIWTVDQRHPAGDDGNDGSTAAPLRTIQAAATRAEPGDTVLIRGGVYRERVAPARGGTPSRRITYMASPGEQVCIRGSEPFCPDWQPVPELPHVLRGSLEDVAFGVDAYAGVCDERLYAAFNPYHLHFNRAQVARPHGRAVEQARQRVLQAEQKIAQLRGRPADEQGFLTDAQTRLRNLLEDYDALTRAHRRRYRTTLGQLFLNGEPMREVETFEELSRVPGSWIVDGEGGAILFHPPGSAGDLADQQVEISVRHTVFAPLERGLGYITVRGLVIEHAANHFPTWGRAAWAQAGALSCRSGHHWIIEDCVVRHAKSVGIDCGREGGPEQMEYAQTGPGVSEGHRDWDVSSIGYHVIRRNRVCDNGHCGIAGIGHTGTRVVGNVIERNNAGGHTSPWWEFAGIKFHHFFDGLIAGNLVRDNDAHGIWLDNQWRGSRVTRNVIVNNTWSGINVELGRGPLLVDHNIVVHTRQGDGIYGHDCADVTIAHNLIYANANFGIWFAFATPRVKPGDGCHDIRALNNMILGNRAGAIGLPLPWEAAGNNRSDGNLLMGAGEYLDEGSGARSPLFQITSVAHMAPMQQFLPFPAMTDDRVCKQLADCLRAAGVAERDWPNLETWTDHYLLGLRLWQQATGNDTGSAVLRAIRDGFSVQRLSFQCRFDDSLRQVRCVPCDGLDGDVFGAPLPQQPLPGPFQELTPNDLTNLTVWPVPGYD